MEKEMTVLKKGEKKLKEWKQQVEELNVQLHLGVTETKEEFEKQKKNLSQWLDSLGTKLEDAKDISQEKLLSIKSSLEELRLQTALGKAETEDHFREQQRNISLGLHDLKQKMSRTFQSTKEGAGELVGEVSERLEDFHTRFDLFMLRLHLGKNEVQEEWEEKKKELSHKLAVLKAKLNKAEKNADSKLDSFSSEMNVAWQHFKKAFKN